MALASSGAPLTLADWRSTAGAAAHEIATRALGMSGAVVRDPVGLDGATAMVGARIPLIGEGEAFDIALVSSPAGCEALSRAILGGDVGAALRCPEIADAIGELVNMLAGSMKRRLAERATHLALGRPIVLHGSAEPSGRLAIALPIRFGAIETIMRIAIGAAP